jgi:hypothetical protein
MRWTSRDWLKASRDAHEGALVTEIGERAWLHLWDEGHEPQHVKALLWIASQRRRTNRENAMRP